MTKQVKRIYTDQETGKQHYTVFNAHDTYQPQRTPKEDRFGKSYVEADHNPSAAGQLARGIAPSAIGTGLAAIAGTPGGVGQGVGAMANAAANVVGNRLQANYGDSKLAATGASALSTGASSMADAFKQEMNRTGSNAAGMQAGALAGLQGLARGAISAIPGGKSIGNALPNMMGGFMRGGLTGGLSALAQGILTSPTLGTDVANFFKRSNASDYNEGTWGAQNKSIEDENNLDNRAEEEKARQEAIKNGTDPEAAVAAIKQARIAAKSPDAARAQQENAQGQQEGEPAGDAQPPAQQAAGEEQAGGQQAPAQAEAGDAHPPAVGGGVPGAGVAPAPAPAVAQQVGGAAPGNVQPVAPAPVPPAAPPQAQAPAPAPVPPAAAPPPPQMPVAPPIGPPGPAPEPPPPAPAPPPQAAAPAPAAGSQGEPGFIEDIMNMPTDQIEALNTAMTQQHPELEQEPISAQDLIAEQARKLSVTPEEAEDHMPTKFYLTHTEMKGKYEMGDGLYALPTEDGIMEMPNVTTQEGVHSNLLNPKPEDIRTDADGVKYAQTPFGPMRILTKEQQQKPENKEYVKILNRMNALLKTKDRVSAQKLYETLPRTDRGIVLTKSHRARNASAVLEDLHNRMVATNNSDDRDSLLAQAQKHYSSLPARIKTARAYGDAESVQDRLKRMEAQHANLTSGEQSLEGWGGTAVRGAKTGLSYFWPSPKGPKGEKLYNGRYLFPVPPKT